MEVKLTGVQIHNDMSDETTCFSATIRIDGRRAGMVSNNGCGGSHSYRMSRSEWAKFSHYARGVMSDSDYQFELEDQYIDRLLAQWEERRILKRHCRRETLFRLVGDARDMWRTVSRSYDDQLGRALRARYGERLERIANEGV